jgi:hypothetical protein
VEVRQLNIHTWIVFLTVQTEGGMLSTTMGLGMRCEVVIIISRTIKVTGLKVCKEQ